MRGFDIDLHSDLESSEDDSRSYRGKEDACSSRIDFLYYSLSASLIICLIICLLMCLPACLPVCALLCVLIYQCLILFYSQASL